MAANHGAANTLNRPRWFSSGATDGCALKYCCTPPGSLPCCGSMEPGMAPSASRNSRISAIRIEVSCRHAQRSQWLLPDDAGAGDAARAGAAASWTGKPSLSTSEVRTSVIAGGDLAEDRGQLLVRHLAEHRSRDVPGLVDHQRAGSGRDRHHRAEVERDRVVRIAHAR